MEEKNNERGKNALIVCLVIIILLLGVLLFLAVSGKIGSKNASTNGSESGNEVTTNTGETNDEIVVNDNGGISEIQTTANWKIDDEAKKYVTLEDVSLTSDVSTKKVKFINLDDKVTSDFYNDQQAVIDNINIYN